MSGAKRVQSNSWLHPPETRYRLLPENDFQAPETIACPLCGSPMSSLEIDATYVCSVCGTSLQLQSGECEAWVDWIEWGSLRFPTA